MAIRLWLAMVMVVGLVGGCTAAATQPGGADPFGGHAAIPARAGGRAGQVVSPMLLISCYPRGHMRILEQISVDQKGAILKEWITIQGRETKKEQLSANELRIVAGAIKARPGGYGGCRGFRSAAGELPRWPRAVGDANVLQEGPADGDGADHVDGD